MRYLLADSGELMLVENAGLENMSSFARPVVREANNEVSLLVAAPLLAGGGGVGWLERLGHWQPSTTHRDVDKEEESKGWEEEIIWCYG